MTHFIAIVDSISGVAVAVKGIRAGVFHSVITNSATYHELVAINLAKEPGTHTKLQAWTELETWLAQDPSRSPVWLFPASAGAVRDGGLVLREKNPSRAAGFDVLPSAIYREQKELPLELGAVTPEGLRGASVNLPLTSAATLDELADRVVAWMKSALTGTGGEARLKDGATLSVAMSTPRTLLPVDRKIDWTRSAAEIVRLARSLDSHGTESSTILDGVEVFVRTAEVGKDPDPLARPGLILGADQDGVLVAAGSGTVYIRQIRDQIGAVSPSRLRVGHYLGGQLDEWLARLERRVSDLEHIVWCLSRDHDFLG